MALLTLSRKFNQFLGPFLLRHGLRARHAVLGVGGGGQFLTAAGRDNPHLDALLGLPLAQWLVSLEVHDETRDAIQAGRTNVGVLDFWFHPKRDDSVASNSMKQHDSNHDGAHLLTLEEETEIRLHVLNKYLRPVLVGGGGNRNNMNEQQQQWSDVQVWQFHHRFIKWARREYFRAKYGSVLRATLDAFPALRQSPQLSPSSSSSSSSSASNSSSTWQPEQGMFGTLFSWNPTGDKKIAQLAAATAGNKPKLPSTSLVTMALGMQDWSQHKNVSATRDSMGRVAKRLGGTILEFRGGALCIPDIPKTAKLRCSLAGPTTTASSSGEGEDKQAAPAPASLLTIEELLEVVGGHVASCGPLNALCEEADIYQLWTREYVHALGQYLLQRTEQFHGGETIVLDVGAGDGLLCEHLRDFFQESSTTISSSSSSLEKRSSAYSPRRSSRTNQSHTSRGKRILKPYSPDVKTTSKIPTVIATDNGSWKVFPKADVEMLGYQESIKKYANRDHINDEGSSSSNNSTSKRQVIILCSWMPMNEDWSATFRHYGVDEYILIGECDDGQCGDNWLTWGNQHFFTDPSQQPGTNISNNGGGGGDQQSVDSDNIGSKSHEPVQQAALYEVDGYVRKDLSELQKFQFSRFDSSTSKYGNTVSFRRRFPE